MQCSCCATDSSNCDAASNFPFSFTDDCNKKQTDKNTTQCNEKDKGSEQGGTSHILMPLAPLMQQLPDIGHLFMRAAPVPIYYMSVSH